MSISFVIAVPEMVTDAATNLAGIGSTITSANAAAAAPTTAIMAAADDEVSAAITALFSQHASAYQAVSAQAEAFHSRFVAVLTSGGLAYAATEASNASPLQSVQQGGLLGPIDAQFVAATGRPLIGNGQPGAPGSGAGG